MNAAQISGNLQKITSLDAKPKTGAIVFIKLKEGEDSSKIMQNAQSFLENGASAIIIEETPQTRAQWENIAARPISFTHNWRRGQKNESGWNHYRQQGRG